MIALACSSAMESLAANELLMWSEWKGFLLYDVITGQRRTTPGCRSVWGSRPGWGNRSTVIFRAAGLGQAAGLGGAMGQQVRLGQQT